MNKTGEKKIENKAANSYDFDYSVLDKEGRNYLRSVEDEEEINVTFNVIKKNLHEDMLSILETLCADFFKQCI